MKVKIINESSNPLPAYGSAQAAAFDLRANHDIMIFPGETQMVDTGLIFELEEGWQLNIYSRSGLALKGIQVANGPAIVDSDYRDTVKVLLFNTHQPNLKNENVFKIKKGDRIAQGQINPVIKIEWELTTKENLSTTERGTGGLGSTGLK